MYNVCYDEMVYTVHHDESITFWSRTQNCMFCWAYLCSLPLPTVQVARAMLEFTSCIEQERIDQARLPLLTSTSFEISRDVGLISQPHRHQPSANQDHDISASALESRASNRTTVSASFAPTVVPFGSTAVVDIGHVRSTGGAALPSAQVQLPAAPALDLDRDAGGQAMSGQRAVGMASVLAVSGAEQVPIEQHGLGLSGLHGKPLAFPGQGNRL
jgi:hypothetical protein